MEIGRQIVESRHDKGQGGDGFRCVESLAPELGVLQNGTEAKQFRGPVPVERPRCPGQADGAEGVQVYARIGLRQPFEIFGEPRGDTQEVVAENPGLSLLHVRVTRHDGARVPRSLFNQGATELVQSLHYIEDAIALIEATHGCALVDTATAGVHLAADSLAHPREQVGLNLQQEASPQGVDRKCRRFHPTQLDQDLEDHLRDIRRLRIPCSASMTVCAKST